MEGYNVRLLLFLWDEVDTVCTGAEIFHSVIAWPVLLCAEFQMRLLHIFIDLCNFL